MVLLVGMTVVAIVPTVNLASASPATQFFVDPPEVRGVMPESSFLIKVNITEAPTTYSWEIHLSYDPALLNLTYIKEGDFLHRWYWDDWELKYLPLYPTTFLCTPFNEANLNGEIIISCSLQGDVPWASGNGWLCNLGFKVKAQGHCILNLIDTRLWDYTLAGSPAYTYYSNLDGFFYNDLFHNIALDNVAPDVLQVYKGAPVTIRVTVANKGNYTETSETFNITVYADTIVYEYDYDILGRIIKTTLVIGDEITIGTQTVTEPLAPGATTILTFTWDTGGVAWGDYTISAEVKGEHDDTRDNIFINGKVSNVPYQDVAVANVTANTTSVGIGESVSINVTVANKGEETETFQVTAYYGDIPIETQTISNLAPGNQATPQFMWNTTFASAGVHTIKAKTVLDTDMNATNNEFINGDVTLYRGAGVPIANFTCSTQKPLVNQTITFTSTSYDEDGYITSWAWDFNNDGTIDATTEVATWNYTASGNYKVRLIVNDNDTLTPPSGIEKMIPVYLRPIASFTYSPQNPLINEVVTFNASTSYDPDGTIVDYSWNFGNDQTGNGKIASHTYTNFGTYTVKLNVTDNDGFNRTKSSEVHVIQAPLASFTFAPSSPKVFQTITFNASSSTPNGGSITRYFWDFGDDNTANETDPITSHSYTPADTYTVTLTVTDSEGLTDTATQSIAAEKLSSTTSIDVAPSSIKKGESVTITGSITPERKGVTVTILYRLSGEETWDVLDTETTSDNSQYSHDWTPTAAGTFEIKASWNGDLNTVRDESDIKTITVQETSTTPDSTLLLIAGIIIVIAVAVAVYFLKFRKQKTQEGPPANPS